MFTWYYYLNYYEQAQELGPAVKRKKKICYQVKKMYICIHLNSRDSHGNGSFIYRTEITWTQSSEGLMEAIYLALMLIFNLCPFPPPLYSSLQKLCVSFLEVAQQLLSMLLRT